MHRSISPTVLALAGAGTLLSAGSCSGTVADPEAYPPGMLAIQLQPGAAIQLEMLDYDVKRNGGFERKGPVAVAQANAHNTFAFKVEDLPPAADYALAVNADAKLLSADALTHCQGGTSFAIDAGKSTAVSLRIQCDGVPTTGSRVQTPDGDKVNQCPLVQALRAVPAAAPVGKQVMLKADIQDAMDGPKPLNYAWSTASGTLSGTNTETSFTCTRAGVARITLALTDGDPACADASQYVYVVCTDAACLAANSCETLGDFPGHAGSGAPALAGHGASDAGRGGAGGAAGAWAGAAGTMAGQAGAAGEANPVSQSSTHNNTGSAGHPGAQAGHPGWPTTGLGGHGSPATGGTHAEAGASGVAGQTDAAGGAGASGSTAAESGGAGAAASGVDNAGTGGMSGSPDLTPQAGDGEEHRTRTRNRHRGGAGGAGGNAVETSSNGEEAMAGASGSAGSAPEEAGSSGSIDVGVSSESDAGSGNAGSAGSE